MSRADEAADGVADDLLVGWARAVLAGGTGPQVQLVDDGFWCHAVPAGASPLVQGWKLHLSATPLSAPHVLARALPELMYATGGMSACPFKFAGTVDRVRQLTSRGMPRGNGGKFLTVYPPQDPEVLLDLAERLHTATQGLPGPRILSDRAYRPGSLVHYRYGAFHGVRSLTNDGGEEAMLQGPTGELVMDQRRAWFSVPPWVERDPFTGADLRLASAGRTKKQVLLDGRFAVRAVIRHSFAGGVFRAVDERSGLPVVLKQARAHTASELTGEDSCAIRRREADLLTQLAPTGVTPRLVHVFGQQNELFVALEEIPGGTLREWVNRNLAVTEDSWGPPPDEALRIAVELAALVAVVHAQGFVLRDLNPNNVMVTDAAELRLVDVEGLTEPGTVTARLHTPGYAAPEQVAAPVIGPAPGTAADLYSLGATLFHLTTGLDPVFPGDSPASRSTAERVEEWLDSLVPDNPAARLVAGIVVDLLHENPDSRPSLTRVRRRLEAASAAAVLPQTADLVHAESGLPTAVRASTWDAEIRDAVEHLLASRRAGSRLWLSSDSGADTDPLNVQHGASGVLGVLARVLRSGADPASQLGRSGQDPALPVAVREVAGWVDQRALTSPRNLPGLYFGRAGTAVALVEAGLALGDGGLVRRGLDLAEQIPLRWPNPDVCHGAAGAGLAQLRCWEVSGETRFRTRAVDAADALMQGTVERGPLRLWPVAAGFDSALAGISHYGFAHGSAGVGSFLLAAGLTFGRDDLVEAAASAAIGLLTVAEYDRGAAYWPSSADRRVWKSHWCSGSSGIGTFLARVWAVTGDAQLEAAVRAAALAVHRSRWTAGSSQCHGLAGDADFLLDLAQMTGDHRYHAWAQELAVALYRRHALRDGRRVPADETGMTVSADYGTGLSGVLALLVRLRAGGPRLWLPDILTDPHQLQATTSCSSRSSQARAERR